MAQNGYYIQRCCNTFTSITSLNSQPRRTESRCVGKDQAELARTFANWLETVGEGRGAAGGDIGRSCEPDKQDARYTQGRQHHNPIENRGNFLGALG